MNLALGVLAQCLLAYALLPEGRGAYAVCVLFGDLAGVIFTLGSSRGAQYLVMAGQLSVSQGTSIAFAFCLLGSAVATLVGIPLIHSDLGFFDNADMGSFYLALLLIPTSSLTFTAALQLEGLRRFRQLAVFSFFHLAVRTVAIVALVWGLGLGMNGAILALALGHMVMIGVCVMDLRRYCSLVFELPSPEGLKGVFRYGLKEYLGRVGQVVDPRVGDLLLSMLASRGEIGLFSTGNALITRVLEAPAAVSTYLLPRVAGDETGRPELAAFCARLTWWTVGSTLLAWFAISTHLVPLLLSDAFVPVIQLTWIMSIGVFAYSGTEIFVAYFRGINRPQILSYAMWIGLSTNVALFFVLYPAWGLHGAAWALTGGLLTRSLFLGGMFQNLARLPLSSSLVMHGSDARYLWGSIVGLFQRRI